MNDQILSTMLQECRDRVENLEIGETFVLSALFGEEWLDFVNGRVKVSQRAAQNVATLGLG